MGGAGRSDPLAAVLVLLTPVTGQGVLATGLLVASLLAVKLLRRRRASPAS